MRSTLPRLSHKDYVFLADIIASLSPNVASDEQTRWRQYIAEQFGDALRGTNPAYSRDRFIAAATGKPYSRRDVQR